MFRQLQHPGFRPRGRVRGLQAVGFVLLHIEDGEFQQFLFVSPLRDGKDDIFQLHIQLKRHDDFTRKALVSFPHFDDAEREQFFFALIQSFLVFKGESLEIERMLFQQMQELAAEMKFEEAQKIKKKYLLLENYRAKSEVVSNVLHNIDVFSIEEDSDEKSAFVNYLHITNGSFPAAGISSLSSVLLQTSFRLPVPAFAGKASVLSPGYSL